MPTFQKASRIMAEPRAVFQWHARPEALSALIPPWEAVTVEKPPVGLKVGTEVILVNQIGPFRRRWVAVHTEFVDRGERGGSFTDVQRSGPFKRWIHQHVVSPHPLGGALLEDIVTWELPLAPVSRWILGRWVSRKISKMFDFRHESTARSIAITKA